MISEAFTTSNEVNILYQSSERYAPIMGVSITSMLENNKHLENINIYIIDGGISVENRVKLKKLSQAFHTNIFFINGKTIDDILSKRGVKKWRDSYAMYYKIYALDLIDRPIKRLLAIDADTIINKTRDSLYKSDLDNKILGMVQDFMPSSYIKKIGMEEKETYYNSGVVLFDVEKWKLHDCRARIEQFLQNNMDCILYADQDAISVVLQKEIKKLPINYNYYTVFSALNDCLSFSLEDIYRLYDLSDLYQFYPLDELRDSEDEAVVYHYEGGTVTGRPWEKGEQCRIFAIWERYKELSFWNNMEKFDSNLMAFHDIELKLKKVLPLSVFTIIYKKAYDLYWNRILKIRPNNK